MAALVCELCGGKLVGKAGGVFACDSCGMEYSKEWAQEKIQEIRGSVQVEGTVDVSGSAVKVENIGTINNYLTIGENALLASNGKQAETYANKSLEIDPSNSKAWELKMKSYKYTATYGDLRILDVVTAGTNVIRYSNDKETSEKEVYEYYLTRAIELIDFATEALSDVDELKNTKRDFSSISFIGSNKSTAEVDETEVNFNDSIANQALTFIDHIPEDIFCKYTELSSLIIKCANAYENEISALKDRVAIYNCTLNDDELNRRRTIILSLKQKAKLSPNFDSNETQSLDDRGSLLVSHKVIYIKDADLKYANNPMKMVKNKFQTSAAFNFYEQKLESEVSRSQPVNCYGDNSFSAEYSDIKYSVTEVKYAFIYKLLYITIYIKNSSYTFFTMSDKLGNMAMNLTANSATENSNVVTKKDIEQIIELLEKKGAKRI